MPGEYAIDVRDVTKIYKLYDKPIDRLKESLNPFHRNYHRDFYALNHISFQVKKGETVGIIGTNGSGKSTILKIITGVLTPTTGTAEVDGVISALLELGAGFNMDYTGIENIYMNGTMMGFSRKEMDEKLQDILDFADIGDFVYQPVKTYSSGMFVRLAFALAINVDPEILIVDEALSVGDVFFQAKCYRRMEEIRKSGTTILMVTHDMGSIIKYCDKVVLLNKGEFVAEGAPGRMVDMYKKILAGQMDSLKEELEEMNDFSGDSVSGGGLEDKTFKKEETHGGGLMKDRIAVNANRTEYGDGRAEIFDFGLEDQRGNLSNLILKGEMFTIREKIRFYADIKAPIFTYTIKDKKGTSLTGTNTMYEGADIKPVKNGDMYEVSFTQKMTLQGGEYLLSMSCTGFEGEEHVVYHRLYDVASITVISNKNTVGVYDMESTVEAKLTKGGEG
ncbi:MAG TPA: ABC transporter ATP-binding protein [Candidatus Lachnoclostridium stercorigallinarum]|mgnify:CR=1 FL=1|uniref:ABC transporter ATP-binding protein n=1 Tax=Candidatus Lachnoclostridium stercorigallinarum TaxID=2838634 RepID=A0A9D2K5S4_9FIRM|nr:ABC transporter ATP-binding protein [Candidatus Lachnoclostridium stercorigallinarum]